MENIADSEILALFRSGRDNEAFSLLIKKYQKRLYYHIRRMVKDHDNTDDVLQNTFIKAWAGLKNFREDANLFTWLYRIATNETLNFLQKSSRMQAVPVEHSKSKVHTHIDGDASTLESEEIQKRLEKAIELLPERQKLVFNMRYYDELPYEEISKILETSVGALKASFHHAVKKIEDELTGN